ncbi:MAG: NOP5/NOP56 family protein [Candidatus Micrarchaeota archaeon]
MDKGNKRFKFMKKSREKVKDALKSRDMVIGTTSKTIGELDAIINSLGEKLEDWYAIYFPELKCDTKVKYARAIVFIDKKNINISPLAKLVGAASADSISKRALTSLGADLPEKDLQKIKDCANMILELDDLRAKYQQYENELADEICPNIKYLIGSEIAAKLIAHAGSMRRLALMPASTIQVIGAEKALFKHLKNKRINPPKHGIIFQYAKISASPKAVRGKIARVLANNICTAAKADAFTKNDISKPLKEKMDGKIKAILDEWERKRAKNPELAKENEE